jgi:MFS family permease
MPAVLAMWQANISVEARSKLWGLTVTTATLVSMMSAYLFGKLLDYDPFSFRWLFPVLGIVGALSVVTLALSPLRGLHRFNRDTARLSLSQLIVTPVRHFITLLSTDRKFFAFEAVFFLYGLALMLTFPVVPQFMDDVAGMSYAQAGLAGGTLGQLGIVFLSPIWGKLMDRTSPQFLCSVVFAILAAFPALLFLSPHLALIGIPVVTTVYVAYLVFGIGMSGISVAWSVAPVTFAGDRDASAYSGAHVTLTGIRGTFGPILGALALEYMGYKIVFSTSTVMFILAALGMAALTRIGPISKPTVE